MSPSPLGTERQTGSEAAVESGLHGVVMVRATARLEIHLSKTIPELQDGNRRARRRIHTDADDAIGPTAQEQIPALTADIRHGQDRFTREFLLHRSRIRKDPLGYGVRVVR